MCFWGEKCKFWENKQEHWHTHGLQCQWRAAVSRVSVRHVSSVNTWTSQATCRGVSSPESQSLSFFLPSSLPPLLSSLTCNWHASLAAKDEIILFLTLRIWQSHLYLLTHNPLHLGSSQYCLSSVCPSQVLVYVSAPIPWLHLQWGTTRTGILASSVFCFFIATPSLFEKMTQKVTECEDGVCKGDPL